MDTAFFASVRNALYGGAMNQAQVDSLNAIGQAWEQYGDGDARKLAYILATAHHETGAFKYMREIWGPTTAQNRYEGRADLGNVQAGDGKKFMGRGFVQLTGRRNYQDWSKRTGLDLIKEPQLVQEPSVAARILVQGSMLGTFTGKKLGDFATFKDMRRVINGTDRADMIAGYASKFLAALQASDMGVTLPPPPDIPHYPQPIPALPRPETPARGPALWFIVATIVFSIVAFLIIRSFN
jgi:predicted chitinase